MTVLPLLSLLLVAVAPFAHAANILVVVPVPAPSHVMLFTPLVEELATRGHNVTFVTPIPIKKPGPNLIQVTLPKKDMHADGAPDLFEMRHMGAVTMAMVMPMMGGDIVKFTMDSKEFQAFVKTDSTFDAIIVEAFLSEAVAAGLSYRFKAPLIGYGTFMPSYWVNYMVGNEAPSSYIPDPILNIRKEMDFCERMKSLVLNTLGNAYHQLWHLSIQDGYLREYFGADVPYVGDIIRNMSLLLVNDHFALSFPRPAVPNLISIGGLHVKPPKPLPKDLQTLMDQAKNGVVLFSLGSNLQSADMGEEKIKMFLDAFSKLKETVIWKFEKDLPNKPKNVIISPWLPQSDILAHPNLKLFITHGGLLSTTESVERGVPLVGIPIFGDQPMNMRGSVEAGVGLSLNYDTITSKELADAVNEVISNPKYKQAAVARSIQLKDKPQSAMDLAIYWIEYVIRHKGAPHLRSAVQNLTWYQSSQADVIAVLLVGTLVALCITKKLVLVCYRRVCKKTSDPKKKKE